MIFLLNQCFKKILVLCDMGRIVATEFINHHEKMCDKITKKAKDFRFKQNRI